VWRVGGMASALLVLVRKHWRKSVNGTEEGTGWQRHDGMSKCLSSGGNKHYSEHGQGHGNKVQSFLNSKKAELSTAGPESLTRPPSAVSTAYMAVLGGFLPQLIPSTRSRGWDAVPWPRRVLVQGP
jgi:hypothetical protein